MPVKFKANPLSMSVRRASIVLFAVVMLLTSLRPAMAEPPARPPTIESVFITVLPSPVDDVNFSYGLAIKGSLFLPRNPPPPDESASVRPRYDVQLRIGNTDVPNQIISNDGSYIVTALKYVPGGTGTVGIKLGSLVLTQRAVGITRDCDIQRSCVYTIQLID